MSRRAHGFTLIEVLAATFVFALVVTVLLGAVARFTARLTRAREEVHATELAEQRVRELREQAASGAALEEGVETGEFEGEAGLHWEVRVEPFSLPLPEGFEGDAPPSPIFAPPRATPVPPEPVVQRVAVRVMTADQEPDDVVPFVFLAVQPAESPSAGDISGAVEQRLREALP